MKGGAPGSFITMLRREAVSAGGHVTGPDTRYLKRSRYDHPTETFAGKPLSQRWHVLGDSSGIVQRDIHSVFSGYCPEGHRHQPPRIEEIRAAQGPAQRQSGWRRNQPASGEERSFPPVCPAERVGCRKGPAAGHGPDAVAKPDAPVKRGPGDPTGFGFATPRL